MLALPTNTCFLSTIQNLLWRTPLVKRPKFTFLTWTPLDRRRPGRGRWLHYKSKHTAVNVENKARGVTSKPFCFKIFKSVELVLTLGTLVTTRTDTFLEGNSSSPFRISLPCRGQNGSMMRPFHKYNKIFNNVSLCFSWQLTGMSEEELTLMSSPVKVQ